MAHSKEVAEAIEYGNAHWGVPFRDLKENNAWRVIVAELKRLSAREAQLASVARDLPIDVERAAR